IVYYLEVIFFFQAEDGIRGRNVTGVQTCALPISCCTQQKNIALISPLGGPDASTSVRESSKGGTVVCFETSTFLNQLKTTRRSQSTPSQWQSFTDASS